jgi:hypothetical protein
VNTLNFLGVKVDMFSFKIQVAPGVCCVPKEMAVQSEFAIHPIDKIFYKQRISRHCDV